MGRECLNCGKAEMVHVVKDLAYIHKGYYALIPQVSGWHCSCCKEVEFDAGEDVRYAEAIKRIVREIGIWEAAELARIRKKLKLTQLEAARLTGGGPNAFSRYEHRKAKPMPAVVNLFRLLDRHPQLLHELKPA